MHRVHEKSHFFLRDEALLVAVEDEEAELQHLGNLEEAVGGHGGHELAKVDGFTICRLDEVEQAITKDRARHEDYLIIEVGDRNNTSTFLVVLLEHVPQHADVLFLRSERFCQIRTKKHPRPRRTETTRCNEVCKQRDAEIVP